MDDSRPPLAGATATVQGLDALIRAASDPGAHAASCPIARAAALQPIVLARARTVAAMRNKTPALTLWTGEGAPPLEFYGQCEAHRRVGDMHVETSVCKASPGTESRYLLAGLVRVANFWAEAAQATPLVPVFALAAPGVTHGDPGDDLTRALGAPSSAPSALAVATDTANGTVCAVATCRLLARRPHGDGRYVAMVTVVARDAAAASCVQTAARVLHGESIADHPEGACEAGAADAAFLLVQLRLDHRKHGLAWVNPAECVTQGPFSVSRTYLVASDWTADFVDTFLKVEREMSHAPRANDAPAASVPRATWTAPELCILGKVLDAGYPMRLVASAAAPHLAHSAAEIFMRALELQATRARQSVPQVGVPFRWRSHDAPGKPQLQWLAALPSDAPGWPVQPQLEVEWEPQADLPRAPSASPLAETGQRANEHRRWTIDETRLASQYYGQGYTLGEIGQLLGRRTKAIRRRVETIAPDERVRFHAGTY